MAMDTPEQIEAFKSVAIGQGYDPKEVEGFIGMAKAAAASKQAAAQAAQQAEMAQYEQKLQLQNKYNPTAAETPFNPETDPTFQRQIALDKYKRENGGSGELTEAQKVAITEGVAELKLDEKGGYIVVPKEKALSPMQWAADNQVMNYLTGKDIGAREAQAAAMQRLGVEGYFKASPLPDLLSEKETTAREAASALLNQASSIVSQVEGRNGQAKNASGVGLLGRFRPDFTLGSEGKTLRQDITNLTAAKMKEISGAAISEQEAARLAKALPQIGDTEKTIMTKAKNIADAVEIGLQMQEFAKRERLTLDQAYKKYGAQAFSEKGQPVPSWIKGGSSKSPGSSQPGLPDKNNDPLGLGI